VSNHPALGYTMVATAATLFAVNGTVLKVILGSGIDSQQLTEVRCAGALLGLGAIALATRPASLRIARHELHCSSRSGSAALRSCSGRTSSPSTASRIGIALVIQFVGPILVALWARYVYGERVRRRIWVALVLALAGLVLVVELWHAGRPNAAGLVAAAIAAVTYASYILLAERAVRRRPDPIVIAAWGFFFATVFWSILAPWWSFPGHRATAHVSLLGNLASSELPVWALILWMVVLGTIVPFALVLGALRHISATRAGITGMLEPVVAIVVAWLWLGESLDGLQMSGAAVTLAGVSLALSSR
jgi:drug/metabolite transporter (DMT)-like permease